MMAKYRHFPRHGGAVLALLALGACSGNVHGLRVGVGVGHSDGYAAQQHASTPGPLAPALARQAADSAASAADANGMIVVGETGVLNKLTEVERAQFYGAYLKAARPNGAPASLEQQADFVAQIGGLSRIETYKVPGLMRLDLPLAVPVAQLEQTAFASNAASLITGATGDLIAARQRGDGLLVLEQVLCKQAHNDYRSCVDGFAKGRFDARTGSELDTSFKPKADGARIDTATYRRLKSARAAG